MHPTRDRLPWRSEPLRNGPCERDEGCTRCTRSSGRCRRPEVSHITPTALLGKARSPLNSSSGRSHAPSETHKKDPSNFYVHLGSTNSTRSTKNQGLSMISRWTSPGTGRGERIISRFSARLKSRSDRDDIDVDSSTDRNAIVTRALSPALALPAHLHGVSRVPRDLEAPGLDDPGRSPGLLLVLRRASSPADRLRSCNARERRSSRIFSTRFLVL